VSNYDAFTHLSQSLFKKRGDLFAMLTAYFDDSGDGEVAVVAGYLSSVKMWEEFGDKWTKFLQKNNVNQMHRSQLESFKGEFEGWIPDQRTEFVKAAHVIIRRYTYVPVGIAIIKKDLEAVFPPGHSAREFRFYSWCIHGCLAALGKWSKAHKKQDPISFVFEAGTEGRDQVDKTFASLYRNPEIRSPDACKIESWSFAGKNVLPLQAADVVAYELFKLVKNVGVDQGKRKIRYSALDLLKPPVDIGLLSWFDKRAFEDLRAEKVPGWDY
jgi:hypothetical protein